MKASAGMVEPSPADQARVALVGFRAGDLVQLSVRAYTEGMLVVECRGEVMNIDPAHRLSVRVVWDTSESAWYAQHELELWSG